MAVFDQCYPKIKLKPAFDGIRKGYLVVVVRIPMDFLGQELAILHKL